MLKYYSLFIWNLNLTSILHFIQQLHTWQGWSPEFPAASPGGDGEHVRGWGRQVMSSSLWVRLTGWARGLRTQGDLRERGHRKDSSGAWLVRKEPRCCPSWERQMQTQARGQREWKPRALASWNGRGIITRMKATSWRIQTSTGKPSVRPHHHKVTQDTLSSTLSAAP